MPMYILVKGQSFIQLMTVLDFLLLCKGLCHQNIDEWKIYIQYNIIYVNVEEQGTK